MLSLGASVVGLSTYVTNAGKHLGFQYSCFLSFNEQAHHQPTVPKQAATMTLRPFHTKDCRLMKFESHDGPTLNTAPLSAPTWATLIKSEWIMRSKRSLETFFLPFSSLSCEARWKLLSFEPLWLFQGKLNHSLLLILYPTGLHSDASVMHNDYTDVANSY